MSVTFSQHTGPRPTKHSRELAVESRRTSTSRGGNTTSRNRSTSAYCTVDLASIRFK